MAEEGLYIQDDGIIVIHTHNSSNIQIALDGMVQYRSAISREEIRKILGPSLPFFANVLTSLFYGYTNKIKHLHEANSIKGKDYIFTRDRIK